MAATYIGLFVVLENHSLIDSMILFVMLEMAFGHLQAEG